MGLVAGDSKLGEVCINRLDRLAIQLAETVDTIARANGLPTEELGGRVPHYASCLLDGIPLISPQVSSRRARRHAASLSAHRCRMMSAALLSRAGRYRPPPPAGTAAESAEPRPPRRSPRRRRVKINSRGPASGGGRRPLASTRTT